jgi:16S rRNA (uracil1498-N3)-methyltransferase
MGTHRVFCSAPIPSPGESLNLSPDESAHATRVKRLGPGDAVELLDGRGTIARGVIGPAAVGGRSRGVRVQVVEARVVPPPRPHLRVLSAVPKGGRPDEMVDQLSQLGAAEWGPLTTERGVVHPRDGKLERLERIALEASKQSGRAHLLSVLPAATLAEAIGAVPSFDLVLWADATGRPPNPEQLRGAARVLLLIGPEGGWSPAESATLASTTALTCLRLGPHTLRTETAAAAAAAVVMALCG